MLIIAYLWHRLRIHFSYSNSKYKVGIIHSNIMLDVPFWIVKGLFCIRESAEFRKCLECYEFLRRIHIYQAFFWYPWDRNQAISLKQQVSMNKIWKIYDQHAYSPLHNFIYLLQPLIGLFRIWRDYSESIRFK